MLLKTLARESIDVDHEHSQTWGPAFEVASEGTEEQVVLQKQSLGSFPPPQNVINFPEENKFTKNSVQLADTNTTRVQSFEIDAETTQALLQSARNAHTTLTGVISAAGMQATADVIAVLEPPSTHELKIAIACGADTRKLYNQPIPSSILGYHVSGVPTFAHTLTPDPAYTAAAIEDTTGNPSPAIQAQMWETAVSMRAQIQTSLAGRYPLAIAGYIGFIWGSYLDPNAKPTPKPFTLSLTNWGQTPFHAEYGSGSSSLRLLAVRPAVNMAYTTYPILIASTASGKLTISLLTVPGVIPEVHASMLLARIKTLLLTLA